MEVNLSLPENWLNILYREEGKQEKRFVSVDQQLVGWRCQR